MGRPLPLFPLGTVLFPGLVMPLHIFEQRYRTLVRDLMALPADSPREFGVVAIQRGWEVVEASGLTAGAGSARETAVARAGGSGGPGGAGGSAEAGGPRAALTVHELGCVAQLRQVTERPDGRFDIVTVGRQRFRITRIDPTDAPYLVAEVEDLPEALGDRDVAEALAPRVLAAFRRYLRLIQADPDRIAEQLPEDPGVLSYLVAATANLTVTDRQHLLAQPDTASRLRAELTLLKREEMLLGRVRAVPASLADLASPTSLN